MILPDTVEALKQYKGDRSLKWVVRSLGLPDSMIGSIHDILRERHEHVSVKRESRIRIALGRPPVALVEVPLCPRCGEPPQFHHCSAGRKRKKTKAIRISPELHTRMNLMRQRIDGCTWNIYLDMIERFWVVNH
jgi:hypothetical protein